MDLVPYRWLSVAAMELKAAIDYYKAIDAPLALRLVDEVEAAIRRMREYPEAWPLWEGAFRKCRVRIFPYALIYALSDRPLLIVAFAHLKQRPQNWRERMGVA